VIELNQEQQTLLDILIDRFHQAKFHMPIWGRDVFTTVIGGYAGTGKTTMLANLREKLLVDFPQLSVAFATFTGKAASVLQSKLDAHRVLTGSDFIGTIHSLIYKPLTKWDKQLKTYVVVGWKLKDPEEEFYQDVIIIDEGSMVSQQIWFDLLKMERPIIVMGDHGQLPPIGDSFSLMKSPEFLLTKIHRQALNSPIIKLSKFVRDYGYIPTNRFFSKDVFKLSWKHPKCKDIWDNKVIFDDNLITLCAFNSTRVGLNTKIREKLEYPHDSQIPAPGERVVCLQNDHQRGIMNGQIGSLIWLMPESYDLYRMTIQLDQYADPIECTVAKKCFGEVTYTNYDKSKF
jgi:exodeoxyribonuclease-5